MFRTDYDQSEVIVYKKYKCVLRNCIECNKDLYIRITRLTKSTKMCQKCAAAHYNKLRVPSNPVCKHCNTPLSADNRNHRTLMCIVCANAESRERAKLRKRAIFDHYGGACACCGESRIEFLTLDHVNNDGAGHSKKIGGLAGEHFYRWIVRNNYPEDVKLQVLCWNCNCSKGTYGYCPHHVK